MDFRTRHASFCHTQVGLQSSSGIEETNGNACDGMKNAWTSGAAKVH